MNDWVRTMVLDVYRLAATVTDRTNNNLSIEVLELVCQAAIHKLRTRMMFAAMSDRDDTGAIGISLTKFDW